MAFNSCHCVNFACQKEKEDDEGKEKADELAKEGAVMHGGNMAHIRASSVQQRRRAVHAALQSAASFHCLVEEWADRDEPMPKPKAKMGLR